MMNAVNAAVIAFNQSSQHDSVPVVSDERELPRLVCVSDDTCFGAEASPKGCAILSSAADLLLLIIGHQYGSLLQVVGLSSGDCLCLNIDVSQHPEELAGAADARESMLHRMQSLLSLQV